MPGDFDDILDGQAFPVQNRCHASITPVEPSEIIECAATRGPPYGIKPGNSFTEGDLR
jgi:hypothetical protein